MVFKTNTEVKLCLTVEQGSFQPLGQDGFEWIPAVSGDAIY